MKILKLKKTEYTRMEDLLRRAGLVDERAKIASPERLYVNEATYKEIKKRLMSVYKKEFSYLSSSKIEYSVNSYLLNLGPNVLKKRDGGNSIPKGVAIVQD